MGNHPKIFENSLNPCLFAHRKLFRTAQGILWDLKFPLETNLCGLELVSYSILTGAKVIGILNNICKEI
jgi:hypothetical protein